MTAPAFNETSLRHDLQRNTCGRASNRNGSPLVWQFGHSKPLGHLAASSQRAQAASSGKSFWNEGSERGNGKCSLCSTSAWGGMAYFSPSHDVSVQWRPGIVV